MSPFSHSAHDWLNMSADKEVYVESSISLEGKYPQFAMEGADKEDIVVRFSPADDCKVVLSEEAAEDIKGPLELHMTHDGEKLAAVRFPGGAKRWKLERFVLIPFVVRFLPFHADLFSYLLSFQYLCALRRGSRSRLCPISVVLAPGIEFGS